MSEFNIKQWCENFEALPRKEMSEDLTKSLMVLCISGLDTDGLFAEDEMFLAKVAKKRCEYLGVNISNRLAVLINLICQNPAEAVMYSHFLKYKQEEGVDISFESFVGTIFPYGFPDNENLQLMWQAQKGADVVGDNYLDTNVWGIEPKEKDNE